MARLKLSPEFKEAISFLPNSEKDKLLYRLLAKEPLLVEQLKVKLLEDSDAAEIRRIEMEKLVEEEFEDYEFYSAGYLLLSLRDLSSQITFHVRATKDKYGEISLNLLILRNVLEKFNSDLNRVTIQKSKTFNKYVLARCIKILDLIEKLHEDYRMEFEDDLKEISNLVSDNENLMRASIFIGFDINWLYNGETFHDLKPHKEHLKFL